MMTDQEKIEKLIKEFQFNEGTARAWVDFKGRCAYCGEDLLSSCAAYGCGQIDHLLPKSAYPELEWDIDNWVLCCAPCNLFKKDYINPLRPGENLTGMLNENKLELIRRVQAELKPKINERLNEFKTVRDIILER